MRFSYKFIKAGKGICDFDNHVPAPYFRKCFDLDFLPSKAEITICGLGFYELYINGKNITKGPLAPYISNTDDICYYDNYDVSNLLVKGKNAVGILLGNGFRNSFGGFVWDFDKASCRGEPTVSLYIEATDGKDVFELEADETFKVHSSPIIFDELRMGCRYDARLEIPNWNMPDFDDCGWDNAVCEKTPKGIKKLCEAEPIVITGELKPVEITHYDELPYCYESSKVGAAPVISTIRRNIYIYDFGVNSAGVTKLKVKNAKKGQIITVRHAEDKVNGNVSVNSTIFIRSDTTSKYLEYAQTDMYICKGGDEEFIPKFKYDGFRYAYVEGLEKEQATNDALTFLVMNSDLKERASFECSDEALNKLHEITRRSVLSNFYYFPTDCPHREKNGWTGDASVSAEHILLNLTAEKSLKEWLLNIRLAQRADGALPGIVPTGGWGFEWGNGPMWDSVCVNLPYYIYKFTGDKAVIEENLTMIMRYLCYISSKRNEKGLLAIGLGDWVDPFEKERGYIASPLEFTDSAISFDIANKASFLFDQIGRKNEAKYAKNIAVDIKSSIREYLIDSTTKIVAGDCQTSQAVALEVGLFEKDELPEARKRLIEIIHRDGDINACGMIGLRYVFHALVNAGEANLAYKIITSEERTCYGYWLKNGATSLWESFPDLSINAGDSKNHHFLGDISSLFIQEFAGLKPNPDAKDIRTFEISPHFISNLNYARASYKSPFGEITVYWERTGRVIKLDVTAPECMNGKIILPYGFVFKDGTNEKSLKGNCHFEIHKQ